MAWFRASFACHDIFEITGAALKRRGIRLLLADLDNTLVPYGVALSDQQVRESLAEKLAQREPDCRPSIGVDRSHVL